MTMQVNPQYSLGFIDDLTELSEEPLVIKGNMPSWLHGCLIKNGPAMFHAGDKRLAHWFDGFAKLHKFDISPKSVQYSCRFIQSNAYLAASTDQKLAFYEFASSPAFGWIDRCKAVFAPPLTDNTNVNVVKMGKNWLALTETQHVVEFLPESLESVGPFKFDDNIAAQITTAHPIIDPKTGAIYNVHIELSLTNHYLVSRLLPSQGSSKRSILARISTQQPAYMHSFAQTAGHIIIIESPLRLTPADLIFGRKPYVDCYQWHKNIGTRFIVINKETGSYFACEYAERFCFHQVNAFDSSDMIILDLITYPNATIVDQLRLGNLQSDGAVQTARLERFEINRTTKQVQGIMIGSCGLELPKINANLSCSHYHYVYGAGASSERSFLDHIVKLGVQSGTLIKWSRSDCFYGEPMFVRRPDGEVEDDGVLLSIELNGAQKCCNLVVVDAQSMELLAEAAIPNMVPFGFHAAYIPRGN